MNILITLPKNLVEKIISGEKMFEMRKCLPKKMRIGEDGFFVVEKGTSKIRCWCRVDAVMKTYIDHNNARYMAARVCASPEFLIQYANRKKVYLWLIGKVEISEGLDRSSLKIDKNPQQFTYCSIHH